MRSTPVREERSGSERVGYGILAATVAGLAAAVVAAIAAPPIYAACQPDGVGLCSALQIVGIWLLASLVFGIVTALLFRLGPWFIVAEGIAGLLVVQLVIQTEWVWAIFLLLLIPIAAAVATDPGVSRARLSRRRAGILLAFSVAVVIEFVIWVWLILL